MFGFTYFLPVWTCWAGFHKKEWLLLHTSHQIMLEGGIVCGMDIGIFMPGRIAVPGDIVYVLGKPVLIQSFIIIHKIHDRRLHGTGITKSSDFVTHKICSLFCDETFPVEIQAMKSFVADGRRTFYLVK